MAPSTVLSPPDEVERVIASIFKGIDGKTSSSSSKRLTDSDFDRISQLLGQLGKPEWADRPRTYSILRVIGQVHLLQSFIDNGLSDVAIPYSRQRINQILPIVVGNKFIANQTLVTTDAYDLEKANGKHQHLNHDADMYFHIVGPLGKGGYGEVDHVRSKISLLDLARKRVRRSNKLMTDRENFNSFMRELNSLKRLKHHHLVTLLGSYTDPLYIGLLMKEVADCNLQTYLDQTPFPESEKEALRSFYGSLCSAVEYLHRSKVRHKDLKPENILVKNNNILITDFGTALDWSERDKSTTNERVGPHTAAYRAPEVEDWQSRNSYTDIYSLGLVFMDITTVLKGETNASRIAHYRKNGSRTTLPCTNPAATKSWLQLLEKKSPEDNQPLKWIREMTQARPEDRIKASILLDRILAYSDKHKYYSICCEINENIEDNEHKHTHNGRLQVDVETVVGSELSAESDREGDKSETVSKKSSADEDARFLAAAIKGNLVVIKRLAQSGNADIEAKDEIGRTALMLASERGYLSLINFLLDSDANIEAEGTDGWTSLHCASFNGHKYEVKKLLENGAFIEAQTDQGKSPLHLACQNGHEKVIKVLLKNGADIDRETYDGWTALHTAAREGHESIAELLLDAPRLMPGRVAEAANMLATVDRGTNCLHIAARNGHPRLVELFLERGIEIDTPSDLGWTAMHFASVANEIGIILLLIANGAKMEAITRDGATPLHLGASHGSQDVVLKLLEMGVNINTVDTTSIMTPLHYAASRGQLDTLGILLMNKANPKAQDNTDWTPLHYIAGKAEAGDEKWVSCARLLLAEDIDLEAVETSGRTVLHLAASNGADQIVQLLLQHGANIHAESCIEYRPIDYAIMNGHQAVVLRLIKAGAHINGADGRAMYLAVTKGHGDVARLLWKHGGSIEDYPELQDEFTALDDIEQEVHTYLTGPNEISPEDRLAIDRALAEDYQDSPESPPKIRMVEDEKTLVNRTKATTISSSSTTTIGGDTDTLIQNDVDAIRNLCNDGFDKEVATEAYIACEKNYEDARDILLELYEDYIVRETCVPKGRILAAVDNGDMADLKYLLAMGGDIDEVGKNDQTALMCASSRGMDNFVSLLLENGADVATTNSYGYTALHFATEAGKQKVTRMLLEAGADLDFKSKKGWTPRGCATQALQGFLKSWSTASKGKEPEVPIKKEPVSLEIASISPMSTGSVKVSPLLPVSTGSTTSSGKARKAPPPVPKKKAGLSAKYGKPPNSLSENTPTTLDTVSSKRTEVVLTPVATPNITSRTTDTPAKGCITPSTTINIKKLSDTGPKSFSSSSSKTEETPVQFASPTRSETVVRYPQKTAEETPVWIAAPSRSETVIRYPSPPRSITPVQIPPSRSITPVQSPPPRSITPVRSLIPIQTPARLSHSRDISLARSPVPLFSNHRSNPSSSSVNLASDNPSNVALLESTTSGTSLEFIAALKKADSIFATDDQGNTALHLAATNGSDLKVRLLLKRGADVDAANNLGNTALHKAAQMDNIAILKLLVGSDANTVAKNNEGSTPLHVAAFYGNVAIVKFLLDFKVDFRARDREGRDVYKAAKNGRELRAGNSKSYVELIPLLKELRDGR